MSDYKPPPDDVLLWTAKQVARQLGVTSRTVWKLRARGGFPLPVYVTPRCPRWPRAAVVQWIVTQTDGGQA